MFSRYSDPIGSRSKNLVVFRHGDGDFAKGLLSALQETTATQPSIFHVSYTYTIIDDDTINIYSINGDKRLPDGLVKNVDQAVHVLDYEDHPDRWIDLLAHQTEVGQKTLIIVTNMAKVQHDLDQETHEYIQLALRSVCLKEKYSLMYTSDYAKASKVIKALLSSHVIPKLSTDDYRDMLISEGTDSVSKITAIGAGLTADDLEELSTHWRSAGFGDYKDKVGSKLKAAPEEHTSVTKNVSASVKSLDEFLASL